MGASKSIITIALALMIVPFAAPAAFAGDGADPAGCLAADLNSFAEVESRGDLAGFSGWTATIGYSKERLPMVPTLVAVKDGVACDLTNGFAAFVGEAPATERAALDTALLAVGAIFVDVFPNPVLLPAHGIAAAAPVVTPVDGGYVAEFSAWTERNGVVADFRVVLDGDVDATFVVTDRAVGPFRGESEGWNLLPGDTQALVLGEAPASSHTRQLLGTNLDGTQWRITYFVNRYSSEAEADFHAQMHLDAGIAAYAEGYGWGFESKDPDGIMDLTLDGCACIYGTPDANIHMFPRSTDIYPLLPGLEYRSAEDAALVILGHELFHHFQYGIQQWRHGNWMTEGQARFSETAHVPDATFIPTSLTFWNNVNGMNGFIANMNTGIGGHSYDWSIVWGYLHAHNGGMAFIKAVLEESRTGGTIADTDGVAVINRALARFPNRTHETFADAYEDFAAAVHTHEGFVWGKSDGTQVHDWSTYFNDVPRRPAQYGVRERINTWGIVFVDAKPTNALGLTAATVSDDLNTYSRLFTTTAGVTAAQDVAPSAQATGVDDAVVGLVRATTEIGPVNPATMPTGGYYAYLVAK